MNITKSYKLAVSNLEIDVIKKDIKNMHLTVYPPEGRVRIAAPLKMSEESIRLFAVSKIFWIKARQKRFREQVREYEREYISGESHYFEGKRYLLNVIYHDAPPKIVIRNKEWLDLYVREGSTKEQREGVMMEWYRTELKKQIPKLIAKWEKVMQVHVQDWGIKIMRTRWGSCNVGAKRIWINLELMKKPQHCLEYLVVHEMTHLLERLHNKRFINHMDTFMPRWRVYKKELNISVLDYSMWSC